MSAHISHARTLRISLSCVHASRIQHLQESELAVSAATHGRTQLHAVAERLSISFGDNNWVCSPVSETPWLEPAVEAMCLWQTFVNGQCVRNAMIVTNIWLVSPSLEPTTLAFPRSRSMIDDDAVSEGLPSSESGRGVLLSTLHYDSEACVKRH